MEIYNILEFLRLVSTCCAGKSGEAESRSQEDILNFRMAYKIFEMVGQVD